MNHLEFGPVICTKGKIGYLDDEDICEGNQFGIVYFGNPSFCSSFHLVPITYLSNEITMYEIIQRKETLQQQILNEKDEKKKIYLLLESEFVNTLFLFVILIAVSNAFSFMLNITVKIELNKDKFGIQLMNGRSRKMILIEFAGNILMLVFIAAVAAAYIIRAYFYQNIIFAVILAAEAAGSVLLGILVLGIKLSGTDVELLMREQNG